MMKKNLLQRIVMPTAKDRECRDLFFRFGFVECSAFSEYVTTLCEMYFNTWMNLFAAKKWFHYSVLEDLCLGFSIKGEFAIEIIGTNRITAYNHIDEKLFYSEYKSDGEMIYVKLDKPEKYDAIYFVLRYKKEMACEILSAGWYTDTVHHYENKLAIVTCTFKRESYIYNTIKIFEDYLDHNPVLQKRIHLFVADNGQTLSLDHNYKYTNIYHNINAGGAGGFTRGLIEVCKTKEDYTRCLFMDDDVEIIPESFFRTLILADYLKEKYSDAHINGAMLDIYRKVVFYENLAIQDGMWCHPYHGEANLLHYDEVLRVNHVPERVFHDADAMVDAAWYYSSFPINQEQSINDLPLPFFIRGDDAEWGYRNFDKVFIQLNGICIWHAPFYYRVSKITDGYYMPRNMFIVNLIHSAACKDKFEKWYKDKFNYAIDTYDYVSARLLVKALEDILKGTKLFFEDPTKIMNDLNKLAKENYQKVSDEYKLWEVRDKRYEYSIKRRCVNKAFKICFNRIPASKQILKSSGTNEVGDWFPPVAAFLMKKHVRVYNLVNHTCATRSCDVKLERRLRKEFNSNLARVKNNYDNLYRDYKSNFKLITSYDFWKKYLRLEECSCEKKD